MVISLSSVLPYHKKPSVGPFAHLCEKNHSSRFASPLSWICLRCSEKNKTFSPTWWVFHGDESHGALV